MMAAPLGAKLGDSSSSPLLSTCVNPVRGSTTAIR
jgi:hypothetical protein